MKIHTHTGTVGTGNHIGTSLGFPTANVENITPAITLSNGVYAAQVFVNQYKLNAMLYIGTRPTLELSEKTIEINIFDFNDNIYGQPIQFNILQSIREEQKFESVELLRQQLIKDEIMIRDYFSHHTND